MRKPPFPLLVAACSLVVVAAVATADSSAPRAGQLYGSELRIGQATPLSQVVAEPERFADEPVLLHGKLVDVCQRRGCWTILRDGDAQVRVRFEDYGFFVPTNSQGALAWVEGTAQVTLLSESDARHYESERIAGEPEKIKGPQREVGFEATGVRILPKN
jgi:hypothetical protein